MNDDYLTQLMMLKAGERDRCYFEYGMQDISVFKNNDGKFAISHSPFMGLHLIYTLAEGEFDKLLEVS